MQENHQNRSVSPYGSYMEVQGEALILIWRPEELNVLINMEPFYINMLIELHI